MCSFSTWTWSLRYECFYWYESRRWRTILGDSFSWGTSFMSSGFLWARLYILKLNLVFCHFVNSILSIRHLYVSFQFNLLLAYKLLLFHHSSVYVLNHFAISKSRQRFLELFLHGNSGWRLMFTNSPPTCIGVVSFPWFDLNQHPPFRWIVWNWIKTFSRV